MAEDTTPLSVAVEVKKERFGSRVWGERRPPFIHVLGVSENWVPQIPIRFFGPDGVGRPQLWCDYHGRSRMDPVEIYRSLEGGPPFRMFAPLSEQPDSLHSVLDERGNVLMTLSAHALQSAFITNWKVADATGMVRLTIRERLWDAMWRRLTSPIPHIAKLENAALPLMGFVGFIIAMPFMMVKPRNKMLVRDAEGRRLATVSIAAFGQRPRDDFSVYLEEGVVDDDFFISTAAFAAMQKMR